MRENPINQSASKRALEDTKESFHSIKFFFGVEVVAMVVFALLSTLVMPEDPSRLVSAGYPVIGAAIGLLVSPVIIYLGMLFKAPYKQRNEARQTIKQREQEIKQFTEKRLSVSLQEPRYDYLGDWWLRLRVENPTAIPIPECYGELVSYRLASYESENGEIQVSPESGVGTSRQFGELPPHRHMFPWAPTELPDTAITIGHESYEFLYIAVKRKNRGCFYTPTEMGLKYPNYGLGLFEVELEIGSKSESFRPNKVKFTFSSADFKVTKLESLPD